MEEQVFNVSLGYYGVQGQTVTLLSKEGRRIGEVLGKQYKEMRGNKRGKGMNKGFAWLVLSPNNLRPLSTKVLVWVFLYHSHISMNSDSKSSWSGLIAIISQLLSMSPSHWTEDKTTTCYGLSLKCPPLAPVLEHLVFSFRVWNLGSCGI